jgi:hypothetical protein
MTDEYFTQLYQEAERRLEAQPKPEIEKVEPNGHQPSVQERS